MVCKKCKSVLAADALYCEKCGAPVKKQPAAKKAEMPLAPQALMPLTTAQCVGILLAFCMARAGLILFGAVLALAILGLSLFLILANAGSIPFTGTI